MQHWLPVLATLLIIVSASRSPAYAIVRLFGHSHATALTISASLAQIGEFSFILAGLGVVARPAAGAGRDLILAGAILSILLNPLLFALLDRYRCAKDDARRRRPPKRPRKPTRPREPIPSPRSPATSCWSATAGSAAIISEALRKAGVPLLVIDRRDRTTLRGRGERGIEAITGNAADPEVIEAANLPGARCLLVAIPDAFEGGQVVEQARGAQPGLTIIARAHSEAEVAHLKKHGATVVVMGEHEIAKAMIADIPPTALSRHAARNLHAIRLAFLVAVASRCQ